MAECFYFLCSKGVVEISQNKGERSYKVFLNRFYIGSITNFNNEGLSFIHQVRDKPTFTPTESKMLADIASGKIVPKSIIIPKPIRINGERWTIMMFAPNQYELKNEQGMASGKLWPAVFNGRMTWVSETLDPAILQQIGLQMQVVDGIDGTK
ncbi:hypothetical protein [Pedobacter sp.]